MAMAILPSALKSVFTKLEKRKLFSTRFTSHDLFETLGLKDDMQWLTNRLGVTILWEADGVTNPQLTFEFLSSIKLGEATREDNLGADAPSTTVELRLGNKEFTLSMERFNKALGFHSTGRVGFLSSNEANELWGRMTGMPVFKSS